jgi:predicted ABC-type ATPase
LTEDGGRRPVLIALAGPNGAGKTTFYEAHLRGTTMPFVNADVIAREGGLDPYVAASAARGVREVLVAARESFVFETVLSDPAGEKVEFLRRAAGAGYRVVLCYIGLDSATLSIERVAMRVLKGGHDVPDAKLRARYRRSLRNLARAIRALPEVRVYDNSDLSARFREVARFEQGLLARLAERPPAWLPRAGRRPRVRGRVPPAT